MYINWGGSYAESIHLFTTRGLRPFFSSNTACQIEYIRMCFIHDIAHTKATIVILSLLICKKKANVI